MNQETKRLFDIEESIIDSSGKTIASGAGKGLILATGDQKEYTSQFTVAHPGIWSIETPYLHTLKTVIRSGGKDRRYV
jgi:beta-galactosidase